MTAQPWEPHLARLEGAYEQVDKRLAAFDLRLETIERKIDDKTDGLRGNFDLRFDGVERKIEGLGAKIDQAIAELRNEFGTRFAAVDSRLQTVEARFDKQTLQLTALIVGTWATVMITLLAPVTSVFFTSHR